MSSLVLYGAGGHAKVIYDIMLSNNLSLEYLVDDHHNSKKFYHFEVFKPQKKLLQGKKVIVAVGNPLTRERIVNDIQQYCEFATLVHHSSFVSGFSKLGEGTVVMPQACINAEVKIGKHCIINTSSVIDHDCLIEDFVHISPSVTLAGNVIVKKGVQIGIGARVIPGITIGENAIVGAGTVVIDDVPDGATVVGNPGLLLKLMKNVMENSKIWLSSPHMGGNELKYIYQAFDSNWIAPLGPNVDGFEKDLEHFLGKDTHVAAVSSGTAALHLALIILGIQKNDYVICQSLTFSASANPIIYQNAIPVFVDSEPDTWNICPNALEDAIKSCIAKGKKPKAIIAVSIYGMPYKADEVRTIAQKYDIPIVEDAAEALGSTYKGEKCGTFGDISVLSFNGNKIITTSGGGAIVLKNNELKKKAIFLSTQAKDNAPHYQHSEIGYNYRLSNISAGIGRGQMEVLEQRVLQRIENHHFYKEILTKFVGVKLFAEPNDDFKSNHWLNAILINPKDTDGIDRENLRLAFDEVNIESRPLWKPMHMQPIFEKAEFFGSNIAENLFNNGLCLPSGSNLSEQDKKRIQVILEKMFILK